MLRQLCQHIIHTLWDNYRSTSSQMQRIEEKLKQKGIDKLTLDHFAIIDLPGANTGIPHLTQLFSAIGYKEQGNDYLPEKQNDFLWMAEADSMHLGATEVLPQAVVADFRLDELPSEVKKIIEKYAALAPPSPLKEIQMYIDEMSAKQAHDLFIRYLAGRDWPLPTVKEFNTVHEFNELLSWVLIFGRKPNHFTLSIHLLNQFENLEHFHRFIAEEVELELNQDGGIIKGGKSAGIAQGSTMSLIHTVNLLDGPIEIPTGFVEFVWRYPRYAELEKKPAYWTDYFTGFIAQHADQVIESLYIK